MTFKDLRSQLSKLQQSPENSKAFDILGDKPFWIWDQENHRLEDIKTNGNCCFNHIVGLPVKDKTEYPMFDYEQILYDALLNPDSNNPLKQDFKDKHLWVKKATGLGVTEFILRLMLWLAVRNVDYTHSQMCIVVGPNIDLAKKLIKRMKGVLDKFPGVFETDTDTVLEINRVWIQAFPSNHLDAYRALANPKFILIDEADFFRKGEQEDVRHVSERYIGKSDPFIVMVSTPDAPDGLFEKIEKEPEETCLYKRLKMDYTYGIGKIYSKEDIEKEKISPSFEREYNLKYLGKIGNVFHTKDIENAMAVEYNPEYANRMSAVSMGIDPGFGSSPFGIVVTQLSDEQIQVLYADEFDRPDFNEMLSKVMTLYRKYGPTRVYIDGSNPAFVRSLKIKVGESADYDKIIERSHHDKVDYEYRMKVIPVAFNQEHKAMLGHSKLILEERHMAIDGKRFDKLITALRTAVEKGDGVLDKEATSYDDIFGIDKEDETIQHKRLQKIY